jgi:competence protein ComEC
LSTLIVVIVCNSIIPKPYIEVNFVDVGQGDCTHIRTSHGNNILIDGGGSEQSDYDVGEKILLPYLLKNGIYKIDAIIVSHFHEDHAEGIITLLKSIEVNKIIIGPQDKYTYLYDEILKISKEKNIQIITLRKGDKFSIDGVEFDILFPSKTYTITDDLNNNSLIVKANILGTQILFTGDMESKEENALLSIMSIANLDIDILKVGHHGSKTSSTEDFLSIISPTISIISCGVDNKFGHPHSEVLNRLEAIKSRIYRTDLSGEIMLKIYNNNKIKVSTNVK